MTKTKPVRWANILCRKGLKPYLLIVTDGLWTTEIPIQNSRLETIKRAARDVYGVPNKRILVSEILDDAE